MDEPFDATYYSTAAQVIPVFFLAAVAERFLARQDDRSRSLMLLSLILIAAWGEVLALQALETREEPSRPGHAVIVLAYVLPLILMAADLIVGPLRTVLRDWPARRVNAVALTLGALMIVAGAASLVGVDLEAVVTGIVLVLALVPLVIGFATGTRVREGGPD